MSFIAIIPARLASTRLPNKPLADIGGKPMVVRTAERAMLAGAQRVLVATDHESIANACRAHGIEACMTRTDHASGTDRIAEVAEQLKLAADAVVVNVQGDEPLIDPQLIQSTAELINAEIPMATAAHAIHAIHDFLNPNVVKVVLDKQQRAMYFSRAAIPWARDEFAKNKDAMPSNNMVFRHIGLYAFRCDFLYQYSNLSMSPLEQIEALEQLRVLWHGYPIAVHLTQQQPEAGVDTPEDLLRIQQLMRTSD